MVFNDKRAIIIGAGPAGLTAAHELLKNTDIQPIIYEATNDIGGIAMTAVYKGNRIDMGGHRFFSKSDRVMNWWFDFMPIQAQPDSENGKVQVSYQNKSFEVESNGVGPDPENTDLVMLVRSRLSRIYYNRKFFDYPVALNARTIRNLGILRMARIGTSFMMAQTRQIRPEKNLEDFFINRFGKELYRTFFRDYTEKVWGVPCTEISPEWGAQRIKGLSLTKALLHAVKSLVSRDGSVDQKGIETSLIERFLYPKYGPGQLWEEVARQVTLAGAELHCGSRITRIDVDGNRIHQVTVEDQITGDSKSIRADYVMSTMPVSELITSLGEQVPDDVQEVASGLQYRDFLTVGLLLKRMKTPDGTVPDNWIYIQEPDVKVGRLQIFNNWSEYMVAEPDMIWVGCEYFCNEGDDIDSMSDDQLKVLAAEELDRIGLIDQRDVQDSVVFRIPKAYPAYFGTYDQFDVIRNYLDKIENLFLMGRNGMHKYNNQDHSMLTAMTSVECIANGVKSKDRIWDVNTEQEYHESK